jgi:hypothetical protein
MEPLSHAAYRDLLPRYAANQLSADERAAVETHIAECAECRAQLRQWRTLGGWIGVAVGDVAPDHSAERGLAALQARLQQLPLDQITKSSLNGFDRNGFPSMPIHDSSPETARLGGVTSPTANDTSRPNLSLVPPRRRIPTSALAVISVAVFIGLAASLFYALSPRVHSGPTIGAATATTALTPTPKPTSGIWHTVPDMPIIPDMIQFAPSAPQVGYACAALSVNTGNAQLPSARWLAKTTNGGVTWTPVSGIQPPPLSVATCAVFINANNARDVFVQLACTDGTGVSTCSWLWRSEDGGKTWRQLTVPSLASGWENIVVVGSRLFAVAEDSLSNLANNGLVCSTDPAVKDPHQINDLYTSSDGGKTWRHAGQELINQGLSIVPSDNASQPTPPTLSQTLLNLGSAVFVRTFCMGRQTNGDWLFNVSYWKSTDGDTWSKLSLSQSDLFFTPATTGGSYAIAVSPAVNSLIQQPAPTIQYSRDSGATWTQLPSPSTIPLTQTVDPASINSPLCNPTICLSSKNILFATATPDGSVIIGINYLDAQSRKLAYGVYAIDPQESSPTWKLFAPLTVGTNPFIGSFDPASISNVSLALTHGQLALWMQVGLVDGGGQSAPTPSYLTPLP